jgi:hypothetical protein
MSKITYHKNGHQHEAVVKAKKMLNKIEKQFGGFQGKFYCNIQLTGINEIDRREVKSYVERHLKELKKQIEKQLLQNEKLVNGDWNEQYEEGFYMPTFKDELQLIEAINEVYNFIWNNYPDIDVKKSEHVVFKETTPEGKYNEAVNYFKAKPVYGFNQEYFAVLENGSSKKLYPITFSAYDLSNATGVYAEFQ